MTVLRANVDYFWSIARPRDRKSYGYGGVWVPNNINRTTDCSGIVTHTLDALTRGPGGMRWSRLGISTEAYRYVGGPGSRGPFGTIRVSRWQDIPADAALRIGLQHGAGGGRNSHMSCTLEGVAVESSGSNGQRIGGPARHYNNSLYRDWFYLPGPIVGAGATPPPPATAPGAVYLGEDYENTGPRVLALQRWLNDDYEAYSNLAEDGEFGPRTAAVVREFQHRSSLTIDGIAGPATLAALGLSFQAQPTPPIGDDMANAQEVADEINGAAKHHEAEMGTGGPNPRKARTLQDKATVAAREVTMWLPRRALSVLRAKPHGGRDTTLGHAVDAASYGDINNRILAKIADKLDVDITDIK